MKDPAQDSQPSAARTSPDAAASKPASGGMTRRQTLLAGGGVIVGAAIGVGATLAVEQRTQPTPATQPTPGAQPTPAPTSTTSGFAATSSPQTLTVSQVVVLAAALDRLIPSDENGPGAREAMVWRYIDINLGGQYTPLQSMYSDGLANLDDYAQQMQGQPFAQLEAAKQDAILRAMQAGTGPGGATGKTFFQVLHQHALEGMFGDPSHGGNANFVGWNLIGHPGAVLVFPAEWQAVDAKVPLANKSTYDYPNFSFQA
jgi:gluconate 2-dehydrogenase gamma chain